MKLIKIKQMKTSQITYLIFVFCISFFSAKCFAQQTDSVAVILQAHPCKDRIQLRWLVNNPLAWSKSLNTGYTIERYTVRRNGAVLPEREMKILTPSPLTAAPLAEWEIPASKNNYAAVLAQALYGEEFEVSGFGAGSISEVVDRADALQQRYAFALYAADMCFEAACLAGWGYEDRDVRPGEYYLYRVISSGLYALGDSIRYGFAYTGIDEQYELPRPFDVAAQFGDKFVRLFWNTSVYQRTFTAYQVEKSEDNRQFDPVGMPYTPLDDRDYTLFLDSLAENDKMYFYRVRGISIFGEISEPSDTVSGKGAEAMKIHPFITRTHTLENGGAEITWEFDSAAVHLIRSFDLLRSDREAGPYETLIPGIPVEKRTVTCEKLKPVNYFKVAANGLNGEQTLSFAALVMPIDSIPPDAPRNLKAEIDTTGLVRLKWDANKEQDMNGYKVYRGNRKGEELISLVKDIIPGNSFTDTVNLLNLNTHIYYSVKALDGHYNQSEFSEILEVEKPLKVKPSSPVFSGFESESGGISLWWIPSPDEIIATYSLFRREETGTESKILKTFAASDTATTYKDTETEGGKVYVYTLTAKSKWGIESDSSPEYRIAALADNPKQAVKDLKAKIDSEKQIILLTWKPAVKGKIKSWRFYRSENDVPLSLWKEIPAEENALTDDFPLTAGNKYNYMIIAVMTDGGVSIPEKLTVKY
jgi:fibronectin type 3 domain-containing protein